MSAFSDWNGPGGCCPPGGGGGSLPQIQTLEKLIQDIAALTLQLQTTNDTLDDHIADTVLDHVHAVDTALTTLDTTLRAWVNDVTGLLGKHYVPGTGTGTLQADLGALGEGITNLWNALGGTGSFANETVTAAVVRLKNTIGGTYSATTGNTVSDAIEALKNTINGTNGLIAKLNAIYNATAQPRPTGILVDLLAEIYDATEELLIKPIWTEEDIQTGKIAVAKLLDFDKWVVPSAFSRTLLDGPSQDSTQVLVLGELSQEWRASQDTPIDEGLQRVKSGRAFIKFTNTEPWNAIVDLTVAIKGTAYTGAVSATIAKTATRGTYEANGSERPPLRFFITHGTGTDSHERIYLAVEMAEAYTSAGVQFFVAGINFRAVSPTDAPAPAPNGSVHYINHANVTEDGLLAVSNLDVAGTIHADHYTDSKDHNIWSIEDDGDLAIGDPDLQLVLYSTDRPTVEHADASKHYIAYLTDIAQSIYWQRAVNYIDDSLVIFNSRKVYFNASGDVVAPDAPDIDPTKTIAGVYTSNPYLGTPHYQAFADGDTGLIRNVAGTGNVDDTLADGKYNGVFDDGSFNYETAKITIANNSLMKAGSVSLTVLDGTILEDTNGKLAKVTGILDQNFTAVSPFNADFLFAYHKPQYTHYNGTSWVLDPPDIEIPQTFDKVISEVSFEWSGMGAVTVTDKIVPFFHDTYATWTAHHENKSSMKPASNAQYPAWDSVQISLEGYRTALEQDKIDDEITQLAGTQSDYLEQRENITVTRPGRADKVRIPNPAFIQHRPWTGVGIVDPGTFDGPMLDAAWLLDGGDFTGLNGQTLPIGNAPQATGLFRNAIVRLWRGNYEDMPEILTPGVQAIWNNFANTLRWCLDTHELWYSDGQTLYKISGGELKVLYTDGSWEWIKTETDGGGHWYWSATDELLRFDGPNNDGGNVLWERYVIAGGATNFVTTGGTRIGARFITAKDSVGVIRQYYTTGKNTSAFTPEDEVFTAPTLPADASTKTYVLKAIDGVKTWVEDV
jgi:hypothetical protein